MQLQALADVEMDDTQLIKKKTSGQNYYSLSTNYNRNQPN